MKTNASTIVAILLVAGLLLPASADAQFRNWTVCGGNHFSTCASVSVTLSDDDDDDQTQVMLEVLNLSGLNGTYEGTVFTKIGFFSTTSSGILASTVGGVESMSGGTLGSPSSWTLGDPNSAGGISLDLATNSGHGVSNGIAALCDPGLLPGGKNSFWVNDCYNQALSPVTITFDITGQWDLASSEMLVFGQNGPNELSTQCITGAEGNCSVVPEPVTMVLLGTGLAGLGGASFVRRRKEEDEIEETEAL